MGDYMNNIILSYETSHPDIKIKWIDVPFSEGDKRTLAAILSNNPPDLINLNPDFSAILAQKGALETIRTQKPTLILSIYHNASDFFDIKPLIENLDLGYKFKVHKPFDYTIVAETVLICEVRD